MCSPKNTTAGLSSDSVHLTYTHKLYLLSLVLLRISLLNNFVTCVLQFLKSASLALIEVTEQLLERVGYYLAGFFEATYRLGSFQNNCYVDFISKFVSSCQTRASRNSCPSL